MSSRFNIGSKIYNATTGVEVGDILHDGVYTSTTTPTATDTLLIRQAGQQKQITYDDLTDGKQDTLVSGTNIKTINSTSLLGSGNITISGGGQPTETVLLTRTTTGSNINITALTGYTEIILELRFVQLIDDEGDLFYFYTHERQRLPRTLYNFIFEPADPPFIPNDETAHFGGKITTTGPNNATVGTIRVVPVNTSLNQIDITSYGTLPTGWQLRIIGVTY